MNMAVEYQLQEDPRHEQKRAPQPQVHSQQRGKPRHRHVAVSAKGMLAMVIVSSMIFCVLVGLVYLKYLVAQTQLDINRISSEIHENSNEQTRLEEKLDCSKSVQAIMTRAAALGMSQPSESQILYVQFPQNSGGESMALQSGK
jgi:cell division protein FtsL